MDGDFFVAAAMATSLTKLALRYIEQTEDKKKKNVSIDKRIYVKFHDHSICL